MNHMTDMILDDGGPDSEPKYDDYIPIGGEFINGIAYFEYQLRGGTMDGETFKVAVWSDDVPENKIEEAITNL